MRRYPAAILGGLLVLACALRTAPSIADPVARGAPMPQAPPNFLVSVYARGLDHPGALLVLPGGDVLVTEGGDVSLLRDVDGDGVADSQTVLATGLDHPRGLALHRDNLYVAAADGVYACRYLVGRLRLAGACRKILDLPAETGAPLTGALVFDRDENVLYVAIDSQPGPTVLALRPDGKGRRSYAGGLAGVAGLAVDPAHGGLWTVEGGRTPATLVAISDGSVRPALTLAAHGAPAGLAYYGRDRFPASYRGGLFVAERGAADGAPGADPRLAFVRFVDGSPIGPVEDFLTGFTTTSGNAGVRGRPVAVAVSRDGALLVADDLGRTLWRVAFKCGACTPDPVPARAPAKKARLR